MLKKIFFIIDLWRAYSLASDNSNTKALSLLEKHTHEIDKYKNKFPDYYILKGSLYYEQKEFHESKINLEIATTLLADNDYYSVHEKMYLYSYLYNILANIEYKNGNQLWKEYDTLSKRENYDINVVKDSLKNNFPHYKAPAL